MRFVNNRDNLLNRYSINIMNKIVVLMTLTQMTMLQFVVCVHQNY